MPALESVVYLERLKHRMSKAQKTNSDQLHGTLDMLVLKILDRRPLHGYAVALRIEELSDDVLQVEEGSLTRLCIGWSSGVGSCLNGQRPIAAAVRGSTN